MLEFQEYSSRVSFPMKGMEKVPVQVLVAQEVRAAFLQVLVSLWVEHLEVLDSWAAVEEPENVAGSDQAERPVEGAADFVQTAVVLEAFRVEATRLVQDFAPEASAELVRKRALGYFPAEMVVLVVSA